MQEADHSNSIFVFKFHPLISLFQNKLNNTLSTVISFENMLEQVHGAQHPYCIILADIHQQLDKLFSNFALLQARPDLPAGETERKRFIKEGRNQFFLDLMGMGFTPWEIARATNIAVAFLEKIQAQQA